MIFKVDKTMLDEQDINTYIQAAEYSGLSTLLVELLSKVNLESLPLPVTSFIICFVTVRSSLDDYVAYPVQCLGDNNKCGVEHCNSKRASSDPG